MDLFLDVILPRINPSCDHPSVFMSNILCFRQYMYHSRKDKRHNKKYDKKNNNVSCPHNNAGNVSCITFLIRIVKDNNIANRSCHPGYTHIYPRIILDVNKQWLCDIKHRMHQNTHYK